MEGAGLGRPMPAADAALAGQLARQVGVLAGEVGRIRAVAAGLMGSEVGWAGSAELAFQDSFARRLAEFGPVLTRLDGYAATLAEYARELARVEPGLRSARSRLAAAPGDPVAMAGFEERWRDWDAARRRCIAGLRAAAPAPGHRHWWSGIGDAVSTVEHGMGLAGCSRLLAEVGQGLVAAGLVCALVCPPLAGPIWAAVAVVAVCQLAVDAARHERDGSVGWAELGWDVAGVVPAGRAVRRVHAAVEEIAEYRTAAEADAAIRRLPVRLRSSPLVPGGGLQAHEGSVTHRGHTILKHVKESPEELMQRFPNESKLTWSSSFTDRATAERAITTVLDKNKSVLQEWLNGPRPGLRLTADVGVEIGYSMSRDGTLVNTSKAQVVLRKEDTVLGYYIYTAFPMP